MDVAAASVCIGGHNAVLTVSVMMILGHSQSLMIKPILIKPQEPVGVIGISRESKPTGVVVGYVIPHIAVGIL